MIPSKPPLASEAEAAAMLAALIERMELKEDGMRLSFRVAIPIAGGDASADPSGPILTRFIRMQMKRRGVELRLVVEGQSAGTGDFFGRQSADLAQGQRHLRFQRQSRMAADEDEAQAVVGDGFFVKRRRGRIVVEQRQELGHGPMARMGSIEVRPQRRPS
jgi:hypothetical protein